MRTCNIDKIKSSQKEYIKLLLSYRDIFEKEEMSQKQIAIFIDEVNFFWFSQKDILEFELFELTADYSCLCLGGATYLNLEEEEHYYFKTMGEFHFIADPFLKLEDVLRSPMADSQMVMGWFHDAFMFTIELLINYPSYFYVLPIRELAYNETKEHKSIINEFFFIVLSSVKSIL